MNKIKVKGNVSRSIKPNRVKLQIVIKEYFNDSNKFVSLDKITDKTKLLFDKLAIDKSLIKIVDSYTQQDFYPRDKTSDKKKDKKVQILQVKFKKSKFDILQDLIETLTKTDGVYSVSIVDLKHTKIDKYKKELKIKSVQSAKEVSVR